MRGTPQDVIRYWERAKTARHNHENLWDTISRFVFPNGGDFTRQVVAGTQRNDLVYDSTPSLALRDSTAVIEGLFTPQGTIWQGVQAMDPSIRHRHDVQQYGHALQQVLFAHRNNPRADFQGQKRLSNVSTAAFGNECNFEEEMPNGLIRYESVAIREVWPEWDALNNLGRIYRCRKYTAEQAEQKWGKGRAGKKVSDAMQQKKPDAEFEFLHVVQPRPGYDPFSPLALEMPWESLWIAVEDKHLVDEGGFQEMPYQYGRAFIVPGETYGRGIGDAVLPDTMSLHTMERVETGARELAAQPPVLAHGDGSLGYGQKRIAIKPLSILWGAIDEKGRRLVDVLDVNPRFDGIADSKEQKREHIRKSFLVDLFQIFADRSMTAAEVMVRLNEKGALIAPLAGSQNSEIFGPMTQRELGIHARAGRLPPMPEALREAQAGLELVYENEATRLIGQQKLVSMQQGLAFLSELAGATGDETVLQLPNTEEWAREGLKINQINPRLLHSPEAFRERIQGMSEQVQTQDAVEAFPGVARGVRDLREAGVLPAEAVA